MRKLTDPGPDALAAVTLNGRDDYRAPPGAAPGEIIMAIDWHDFDTEWYAHIQLPTPTRVPPRRVAPAAGRPRSTYVRGVHLLRDRRRRGDLPAPGR